MITVNNNIKNAYNQSTTQTDRIRINNSYYYINNVEYSDDCYEEGNIFGTAIARILTFEIESSIQMEKKEFQYETGALINGVFEYISLGNFIVTETEEGDTTDITKVTAMDYMLKTNTIYETNLNYSTATLLDVLQEVCTNCGLYLATTTFTNSSFRVDSNQFEKNTLNRQVIQAVAQVSGCIAKIKADNRLYLINPNLVEDVSQVFTLKEYAEADIKRLTHPLNLVSLTNSQIEGENITLRDETSIAQNGENALIINDNPFAYNQDKRTQLITPLFNAVKGFEYKSYSFKFQMLPWIETLDKIQFLDKEGNTYNSYVFRFTYKSPNGVESTIESPSETRATIAYQNIPDALEIAKRTEILVDKQNQIIESVVSNVTSQNNKISQIQQTVDELNSKISDIADITTSQETNTGNLTFEDINESEPIHIEIMPLGDNISYLYPFEQLYPADNLYIKLRTLRFTNTETNEVFDYELPDDLLYYDNEHYDKFILDYDSQTCYVNKKCAYDNNGNVTCLANEVINSYTFPHINLTDGDYTVQILKYDNVPYGAYLFCRLMAQNIYTTQFATKAELNSEISQTADSITSTVSGTYETKDDAQRQYSQIRQTTENLTTVVGTKVGENEVCSVISQSPDEINITSNRFSLDSTNFKVTKDGNITAVSGDIGGFSLGETSFKNNLNGLYAYTYYDAILIKYQIMENVHLNNAIQEVLDANSDGRFTSTDLYVILNIIKGTMQNTKRVEGVVEINSNDPKNCFKVSKDGEEIVSIGVGGINTNLITTENFICGCWSGSSGTSDDFKGVVIDSQTSTIYIDGENSSTVISSTGIRTPSLTQTSEESQKKNIEKYTGNALETINSIDIYKYNFKNEDDKNKKHLGFVIGDKYKYSEEVTSNKNDGVDLYSFVSLCCKAIQEQQAEIEELKKRLEEQSND